MTERLFQTTTFATNGNSKTHLDDSYRGRAEDEEPRSAARQVAKRFWWRLQLDEWTFTLLLFLFSSSIVLGKLFLNHDYFSFLDISVDQLAVPTINSSHPYYKEIANHAVIEPLHKYGWLIKAALSGLAITGITWFIIYEDSNVPGVNPPSPFSPSKKRISESSESSSFQMNYLVGTLNGLLVFIYMCL